MPLPGDQLGRYEIVEPLGAGGMGEVYKARDTRLDRFVAIKVVHAKFSDRFEQEARAIAQLNHSNICTLYDVGPDYLVMEYIEGTTLKERLAAGPIPLPEAVEIARQSAKGLAAAHARGILHRDIKPGNIMLTPQGQAKITDFGLAKLLSSAPQQADSTATLGLTQPGMALGTPLYMSPEQSRGEPLDQRSDIYSFGRVLRDLFGATFRPITAKALAHDPADRYQNVEELLADLEKAAAPRRSRVPAFAAATAVIAIAAAAAWFLLRPHATGPIRIEQITAFSDSAVAPALSPDGKMLAFIRGPATFVTSGQIYLKLLPNGEPIQLTHDGSRKMSPVFSPDGSRIAYTVVSPGLSWDTWSIPTLGGEARPWLPNASGLTWTGQNRLLFSEIKTGVHMALVASTDSRTEAREVYMPDDLRGMAHRSYLAPDGKSVLLVEMDKASWLPCRVVPFAGGSPGKIAGPATGRCTYAAWSPDGRWMYFSSDASGSFQIWRQRLPDGTPEQLTFGPTESEGIAVAPDGRSLITSTGLVQRSVWLHENGTERQVSAEGDSILPAWGDGFPTSVFSPDGKKLYYLAHKNVQRGFGGGELWVADLSARKAEAFLPGLTVTSYDISPDGTSVLFAAQGADGKSRIWVTRSDRRVPPRQLYAGEALGPVFLGASGEICFRGFEGKVAYIFALHLESGRTRKIVPDPALDSPMVSPDGNWIVSATPATDTDSPTMVRAYPTHGGQPQPLCRRCFIRWTRDQKFIVLTMNSGVFASFTPGSPSGVRSVIVPLAPGAAFPPVSPQGFVSDVELTKLPGTRLVDRQVTVYPGPNVGTWAFETHSVQRNLYRIILP